MTQASKFITHCILWIPFPGHTKLAQGPQAARGLKTPDLELHRYILIAGYMLFPSRATVDLASKAPIWNIWCKGRLQLYGVKFLCVRLWASPRVFLSRSLFLLLMDYNLGSWVCGWRPAFGQNCSLSAWVCNERPALGQNILMIHDNEHERLFSYYFKI